MGVGRDFRGLEWLHSKWLPLCVCSPSHTILQVPPGTETTASLDGQCLPQVNLLSTIKEVEVLRGRNKVWFLFSLDLMLSFLNKLLLIHSEIETTAFSWWPDGPANLITSSTAHFLPTTLHGGETRGTLLIPPRCQPLLSASLNHYFQSNGVGRKKYFFKVIK